VTIHQLLNHTSGLDNIDKVKSAKDAVSNGMPLYQSPITSEQLFAKCCSGPLVNAPGKVFDYNNADYIVLGKLIEQPYGKPYDQVLNERIVYPLGLTSTGMMTQYAIIDNLADTYFLREDLKALANDLPVYPENWYAAGSMYSTPDDLLKFANALFGLRLLNKATLDLMIKPGLDDYGVRRVALRDQDRRPSAPRREAPGADHGRAVNRSQAASNPGPVWASMTAQS
jgi:CubicO group peptidase (beta-lactamase class C family)